MLKQLDYKEFFCQENKMITSKDKSEVGLGALGLITPNQSIQVYNIPAENDQGKLVYGLGSHMATFHHILNEIYDLKLKLSQNSITQMSQIKKALPNIFETNYIYIRYINTFYEQVAAILIPPYITSFEYQCLEDIAKELKENNVKICSSIREFDPRNNKPLDNDKKYNNSSENIEDILAFLKNNNRIIEYQLSAPPEKIIQSKLIESKNNPLAYDISSQNIKHI